jgi:hypothetical protein
MKGSWLVKNGWIGFSVRWGIYAIGCIVSSRSRIREKLWAGLCGRYPIYVGFLSLPGKAYRLVASALPLRQYRSYFVNLR